MTYYIETIGVEEGDRMPLAMYHLRRVSETLCGVPPFLSSEEQLRALLRAARPEGAAAPLKMRIVYSSVGIDEVTVTPYTYDIRTVRRLQLYRVPDGYRYDRKYLDRTLLDSIASSLPDHETVALLIRGDRVTDTTFTNICLRRAGRWETPDRPLLEGTRRRSYLESGEISAVPVTIDDLLGGRWSEISLINALNPLGRLILPITAIRGPIIEGWS